MRAGTSWLGEPAVASGAGRPGRGGAGRPGSIRGEGRDSAFKVREGLPTVGLRLAPEEPEAGPWRAELVSEVASVMTRLGRERGAGDRPVALAGDRPAVLAVDRPMVLAVDGRSSSGKTTLAARLRDAVPGSAVVHTDDIAWWHSRFGWADPLIEGVLEPARAGRAVAFRPPRWEDRGRLGAIEVPADCSLLIVEGVGAARRESAHLIDVAIWVQADEAETERRNLARVGTPNGSATVQDHLDWMAEEIPFLADQRPWERVDLVVCGTQLIVFDSATELVVAPPPGRARPGRGHRGG